MQNPNESRRDVTGDTSGLSRFFGVTYAYMFLALAVTAVTEWITQTYFLSFSFALRSNFITIIAFFAVQMLAVTLVGRQVRSQNANAALGWLMALSVLEGVSLAAIMSYFSIGTIALALLSTSIMYGVTAIIGVLVKRSLASWGPILFGAVVALIIVSFINILLLHSGPAQLVLAGITTIIFAIFTVYDHNRLKNDYLNFGSTMNTQALAVGGALALYFDFINIFVSLLQIFGAFNRD